MFSIFLSHQKFQILLVFEKAEQVRGEDLICWAAFSPVPRMHSDSRRVSKPCLE